jgi:hypothetical protein
MHELLVRETHGYDLIGHFGVAKTLDVLHDHFYWSKMKKNLQQIYDRFITCKQAKFN